MILLYVLISFKVIWFFSYRSLYLFIFKSVLSILFLLHLLQDQKKGVTEDEMVGCHHWFSGHEFDQALRVGDKWGNLACCSPWGHKESDTAEWTDTRVRKNVFSFICSWPKILLNWVTSLRGWRWVKKIVFHVSLSLKINVACLETERRIN